MSDRIPPRTWTKIWVQENGLIGNQKLYLTVFGQSATNGFTQLWDPHYGSVLGAVPGLSQIVQLTAADFGANGILQTWIRGYQAPLLGTVFQTRPGSVGSLFLVAADMPDVTDELADSEWSSGFSVAAIPVSVTATYGRALKGVDDTPANLALYTLLWGVQDDLSIQSDSGVTNDLDLVEVKEQISPLLIPFVDLFRPLTALEQLAGSFKKGDWFAADGPGIDDTVISFEIKTDGKSNAKLAIAKQAAVNEVKRLISRGFGGTVYAFQYFIFRDFRTGSGFDDTKPPLVIDQSAFLIQYSLSEDRDNGLPKITVVRKSFAINGGIVQTNLPPLDIWIQ